MEENGTNNQNDYSLNKNIKICVNNSKGEKITFTFLSEDKNILKKIERFCKDNNYSNEIKEKIRNEVQNRINKEIKELNCNENSEESSSNNNSIQNENNGFQNNTNNKCTSIIETTQYSNNEIKQDKNLEEQNIKGLKESNSNEEYDNYNEKQFDDSSIIQQILMESTPTKIKKNYIKKKSSFDLGVEMYEKSKKMKKIKDLRNKNNEIQYSFKPTLNDYNKILNKSSDEIRNGKKKMKVENRLLMLGKETKNKLLKKRLEIQEIQENQNKLIEKRSFTPKINKYKFSKKRNSNVYQSLFQDANITKDKIAQMKENLIQKICPFKPQINPNSKKMNCENINEILSKNKERPSFEIIIKDPKIKKEIKLDFDINEKDKSTNKNSFTSSMKKTIDTKKNKWMSRINEIIEEKKRKTYKAIFDMLDNDKDEFISYNNLDTSKMNKKILSIFAPLINDIIEKKEEMMTFKEFFERAETILPQKIFEKKN